MGNVLSIVFAGYVFHKMHGTIKHKPESLFPITTFVGMVGMLTFLLPSFNFHYMDNESFKYAYNKGYEKGLLDSKLIIFLYLIYVNVD